MICLHAWVAQRLARGAAIAAAEDQHAIRLLVRQQRQQRKTLVVHLLAARQQLYISIEKQPTPKRRHIGDHQVLVIGLLLDDYLCGADQGMPAGAQRVERHALPVGGGEWQLHT